MDDFALASPNEDIAKEIYDKIGNYLKLPTETEQAFKYLGLMTEFNGVDVAQFDRSIAISVHNYIDRIMKTHNWITPAENEKAKPGSPLPTDCISQLYSEEGYEEGSNKHREMETNQGFGY